MNAADALAASYTLDAARSRFLVRAYATGLLSSFGHNPVIAIQSFTGEVSFRPDAPDQSSLRIKIDASSLAVTGSVNEKDRREIEQSMRQDVLETASYPEITFESASAQSTRIADGMYRVKIAGKLMLHGITRDLEITCNFTVDEETLRANGEFSIRQTEFAIRPVSAAGGTIKLKDELKFNFDIVGRRRR